MTYEFDEEYAKVDWESWNVEQYESFGKIFWDEWIKENTWIKPQDGKCKKFVLGGVVYYRDSKDIIWDPTLRKNGCVYKQIGRYCKYTETVILNKKEDSDEEE